MKKTKFLVLVLAVAIMMVGAGYAIWQDSVDIIGTVSTGNLDFAFTEEENPSEIAFSPDPADGFSAWPAGTFESDGAVGTITYTSDGVDNPNDDVCRITVTNLFPGASGSANITLFNYSTIPTKLIDIMPKVLTNDGIDADDVTVALEIFLDGVSVCTVDDMFTDNLHINDDMPIVGKWSDAAIQVGEDILFSFEISMDRDATGSELGTFQFEFEPTFAQFDATEREVLGLSAD